MIEISIALVIWGGIAYKLLDKYLDRKYPQKEDIDLARLQRLENEMAALKLVIGNRRNG